MQQPHALPLKEVLCSRTHLTVAEESIPLSTHALPARRSGRSRPRPLARLRCHHPFPPHQPKHTRPARRMPMSVVREVAPPPAGTLASPPSFPTSPTKAHTPCLQDVHDCGQGGRAPARWHARVATLGAAELLRALRPRSAFGICCAQAPAQAACEWAELSGDGWILPATHTPGQNRSEPLMSVCAMLGQSMTAC